MNSNRSNLQSFIKDRISPYAFLEKAIDDESLKLLFEAARRAPSSFNEQPWRFLYARKDDEEFDIFLSLLMEGNREWTRNIPLIGISCAKLNFSLNGKPNKYALHDTGLAMGGLLAQATFMGIRVHQMGGFYPDKAKELLKIPDEYEPVAMFVIGYQGEAGQLPTDLKKRELMERVRKPLDEILSRGLFVL